MIVVGVLAAAGCNEPRDFLVVGEAPTVVNATPIVMQDGCSIPALFALELDPVIIRKMEILGDLLTITVEYAGGCADHAFTLHASRGFLESWPLQSEIILVHDAADDPCDGVVTEELAFDLVPLKDTCQEMYAGGSLMHLNVYESGNPPHYEPQPLYDARSD